MMPEVEMPLVPHPIVRRKMTVWAQARRRIQQLGPYQSLLLLAVPLAMAEPLKVLAIFIAGKGHWLVATAAIVAAYAMSLLIVEKLFRLVKPKLLTLNWFAEIWAKAMPLWTSLGSGLRSLFRPPPAKQ